MAFTLVTAAASAAFATGCGGGGLKVDQRIAVGQDPSNVVAAYGSVWVVNDDAVAKVNPDTNALALKKFIIAGDGANGIAAGGNLLWVSAAIQGTVVIIDPKANKVVGRIPVASRPIAVAYGEGAVWVAEGGTDKVQRVDPVKRRALKPLIQVQYGPNSLAVGDGAVWVANQFSYTVSRIDPATNKVVATIKVGIQPTDVAIGEGGVWVANSNSNSVSRIDPKTNKVVATIKISGDNTKDVTTGFGSVWVSEVDGKALARINPKSNKQTATLDLQGDSPADLAVGFGSIWAPIQDSNLLARIKP